MPTVDEWTNLIMYAGGGNRITSNYFGNYMSYNLTFKSFKALCSFNGWSDINGSRFGGVSQTTDSLAFSAVPAGYCYSSGCSRLENGYGDQVAVFWADNGNKPYYVQFADYGIYVGEENRSNYYYSVRCIKDN